MGILFAPLPELGTHRNQRARGRPRTAPPRRRHVMPLAIRPLHEESGALLAHFTSSPTRLTLRVTIAIPSVRRDAIGAERSNRRTFGSGTLIRFHPRGVKMSELRDSSAGTRSEAIVSAFARREEEQPRDRRAARRNAALGDECARIATRLHSERDNVGSSDVTLGVFVKLSNVHLFRACLNTTRTLSGTELRAAHPNLHSGRLRPLLQVAARNAISQARWIIK